MPGKSIIRILICGGYAFRQEILYHNPTPTTSIVLAITDENIVQMVLYFLALKTPIAIRNACLWLIGICGWRSRHSRELRFVQLTLGFHTWRHRAHPSPVRALQLYNDASKSNREGEDEIFVLSPAPNPYTDPIFIFSMNMVATFELGEMEPLDFTSPET